MYIVVVVEKALLIQVRNSYFGPQPPDDLGDMDSNELNCLIEKTKGILTNLKQQERDIKTEMRRASDDLEEGECESSDEETSNSNEQVEKPWVR